MTTAFDTLAKSSLAEADLLHPSYPRDVSHFDDGTWLCSSASLLKLTRSFQRYGFRLNPLCTFTEFHEKFSFIRQASALLDHLENQHVMASQTPEMRDYLRAVKSADGTAITASLANIRVPKALPVNHRIPISRPVLEMAA
jgi:hypothetical protein